MAIFKKFINSGSNSSLSRKQSSATVTNGLNNTNIFTDLGTPTDSTNLW